jgi:hypothetical protein
MILKGLHDSTPGIPFSIPGFPITIIQVRRRSGFAFPISAMTRDVGDIGDSMALCLRPSARYPPPLVPLLKTKIKVQFDRTVTERSKTFLPVFQGSNPARFQPCFSVFTVRSAEGRKPLQLPCSSQP